MNIRETNHHVSTAIVSFIILLSGVPAAHAAFIQNTFGLSGPHSTITFDEHIFPFLTPVTTEYADLGVHSHPMGFTLMRLMAEAVSATLYRAAWERRGFP